MRGGCAAVKSSSEHHYSVMNRILLRFRPIAPKPPNGEGVSTEPEQERRDGLKNGRRTKRKYVRVRARQSSYKRKAKDGGGGKPSPPAKSEIKDDFPTEKGAVTLQLLPERSSESDKSWGNSVLPKLKEIWSVDQYKVEDEVSYRKVMDTSAACGGAGVTAPFGNSRSVTKTWIIVECVTETFTETGVELGFSDGEKINSLQMDTCPGFVSDGMNKVVWVNEAYRKMVAGGDMMENGLTPCLVVKEELPYFSPSFACRVRMIQQTKYGHNWNKIMQCDVWKMESAGFAWKLDVKTALGLGI